VRNPEVHIVLTRFGVDVADLISLQDRLFEDKTAGTPWDDADGADGEGDSADDGMSLKVTVVGARGLRAADFCVVSKGKSDPYCVCEIPGKAGTQFRTSTKHGTLEPVWNHQGSLCPFVPGDSIRFTVLDEDWGKEDDFLGRATLSTSQFFPGGFDTEVPLTLPSGGSAGFLHVTIEVSPQMTRLHERGVKPRLSFAMFLEAVMRLRGGNSATVHDIVELRGLLLEQFHALHAHFSRGAEVPGSPRSDRACRAAEVFQNGNPVLQPRMLLPGVVPVSPPSEAEGPVLARLDALDAGQRELRSELVGLRAQLSEVHRVLQAYAPKST